MLTRYNNNLDILTEFIRLHMRIHIQIKITDMILTR